MKSTVHKTKTDLKEGSVEPVIHSVAQRKIKKSALTELVMRNAISVRQSGRSALLGFSPESINSLLLKSGLEEFQADCVRTDGLAFFYPNIGAQGVVDTLVEKISNGRYPVDMISMLAPLAHGGVMLDIGANVGLTSIPRAVLHLFDHIHAFEPEPMNAACLKHAVQENKVDNKITVWERAIGASSGRSQITMSTNIGRHCIVDKDRDIIEKYHDGSPRLKVDIRVSSIDDWIDETKISADLIRFVKVDTEGYEPNVLAGAQKLLKHRSSVWQFEVCPVLMDSVGTDLDMFATLVSSNFDWFIDLRNVGEGFIRTEKIKENLSYLRQGDADGPCYTDIITLNF